MIMTRQLWAIALGIVTLVAGSNALADIDPRTGRASGDVAPQNFAEFCEGELPSDRQQAFYEELGKAEQALAAGNEQAAQAGVGNALFAAYRGDGETDISVKCFGQPAARRWFKARLGVFRLVAARSRGGPVADNQLYTAAQDGGSAQIVAAVSNEPARSFVNALRTLERFVTQMDNERKYGAFILPDQENIAKAFRDALGPLREKAAQNQRAALAAEDEAFNRPPTEQEIAAAESVGSAQALAKAVAGADIDTAADRETMFMDIRISESREHLRDARAWDLERYDDRSAQPSSQRARKRGDMLLAKANDANLSLGARDDIYRDAEWYFNFGGFDEQASAAASQRAAIQPALQAEQDRREQQMEKKQAEMQQKAEAMKQAVDDMQKTEAEKQSFNEEADAMEAELGF